MTMHGRDNDAKRLFGIAAVCYTIRGAPLPFCRRRHRKNKIPTVTRAEIEMIEMHHFVFFKVPQFWELKTSLRQNTDLEKKLTATYDENQAKKQTNYFF